MADIMGDSEYKEFVDDLASKIGGDKAYMARFNRVYAEYIAWAKTQTWYDGRYDPPALPKED